MQIIYPREYVVLPSGCVAIESRRVGVITKGRPVVGYEGEDWKCGRLSYHLNVAEIPRSPASLKEGIVCHHCDNPWCINPEHLYLGTQKQNIADVWQRNEFIRQRMSDAAKGNQNNKGKKLNEEQRARSSLSKMGNQNAKGKTSKRTEEQKETYRKSWTEERKQAQSKRLKGNTRRRDHFASRKNNTESS